MSPLAPVLNQTVQGKAYEYACVQSIIELVSGVRNVRIIHNSSLVVAQQAWELLGEELQRGTFRGCDTPGLGVVHRHVLVTGAQRANEGERGQRIDLRRAQAHRTNGEHHPHAAAVLRDGGCGLRCIGGVDHFKGLGHLGDVLFRQKHEGKQDGLHG